VAASFAVDRLDGLVEAPPPGAERTIGDDVIEAVIVETLETAPPDATRSFMQIAESETVPTPSETMPIGWFGASARRVAAERFALPPSSNRVSLIGWIPRVP
jgi:hypothetical protein